jgi:hypothetical protein
MDMPKLGEMPPATPTPFFAINPILTTNNQTIMRKLILGGLLLACLPALAQTGDLLDQVDGNDKAAKKQAVAIFNGQKLINANTADILPKGRLEFKVQHNFGDVGGSNGGAERFFGLDNAADIKIAFQAGLGKKWNLLVSRTRGGGQVQQMWELGVKYQILQQLQNDKSHPLSLTLFANAVYASQKSNVNPDNENSFTDFSSRGSNLFQLLLARKFGKVSFQLNPTFVRRNFVQSGDENNTFAMGAGIRLPFSKKIVLIADYFYPFRSSSSKAALKAKGVTLYDVFGVGFEIKTPGHLFYLNFTNATNLLENRFIPRTFTTWRLGQFRWGFTIARDFTLFRAKK